MILDRLKNGAVTLTTIGLLRPHLTAENHLALLDAVRYQSKREVERLVAGLAPKPDVAPLVRRMPVVAPLRVVQQKGDERSAVARRGDQRSSRGNGRAGGRARGVAGVAPDGSTLYDLRTETVTNLWMIKP